MKILQTLKKTLFAVVILLSSFSICAQGPNAPEASSFEPVDATDMVSLLTGDFTYVMPLLNVPSPEGGYPISLSHHAGIAMDQESSWVGLGWSLNPGAINRNVNGSPDDWRTGTVKEFAYDEGGTISSSSVSIGYGVPGKWSIGVGVSWGSNRSLGGSINGSIGAFSGSIGTDGVSAGIGLNNNLSVSASVGYNGGFGLSAGFFTSSASNVGFSIGVQSGSNGISGSFGVKSRNFLLDDKTAVNSSIGIGLSSSGISVNANTAGFGTGSSRALSSSATASSNYQVFTNEVSFGLTTPWGYFSYGVNSVSWRLRHITRTHVDGAIYPYANYEQSREFQGNAVGERPTVSNLRSMDVYEVNTKSSNFELNEQDSYLDSNNGVLTNFDDFRVNSQGIGGSITPNIGNNIPLYPLVDSGTNKIGYFIQYSADVNALNVVNQYQGYRPHVNFNFQSHGDSFLNVLPYDMSYSSNQGVTYNVNPPSLPTDFTYDNQQKLLYNNNSYDVANNRKKEGSFIEYFTVEEINSGAALSRGFLDVDNNFSRDLNSTGYVNGVLNNIDSRLYLYQNFESSIAAFKITAADGKTYHYSLPIYQGEQVRRVFGIVDNKTEHQAHMDRMNVNPYATHWLLTSITGPDYIKADNTRKYPDEGDLGYWVRFDYGKWSGGYIWKTQTDPVDVFGEAKEYSWGRKQIYYLDKIKTRTHTAVFIKDLKTDSKSSSHTYKNMYHHMTQSNSFMQMDENPLLRLDEIILLKNEDANTIDKSSGVPLTQVKSYDYYTSGDFNREVNSGTLGVWKQPGSEHRRVYQANLSNNVFDKNDIINANIEEKAIKIIKFNSDYSLCYGSPNSSLGKLTLKSVSFLGKGGANIIPSTKFSYSNKSYSESKKNDFGYYEDSPETWSLKKITTPTGANINIVYEPDSYNKVAIKNGRVFTSKLKFSFIIPPPPGDSNNWPEGITRIKIEIDNQDSSANGLVLSDYFDENEPFFMDMWYSAIYNHPNAGYDRSSVNIEAKMANILELNEALNYMVVEVMASSPNFRDVFQSSAEPVSVLHAGGSYGGVENQNLPRYELAWTPEQGWRKYSMRHTIIANKNDSDNNSGIRVKQISVNDQGKVYNTYYDYNDPQTGQTSGIIPYYPEKNYNIKQQVPYVSLLPGPVVSYEYVREYNDQISRQYKFKVLKQMSTIGNVISFGDLLQLECEENSPTDIVNMKNIKIINNLSSLGRVESFTLSNSFGQVLSKTINNYDEVPENFELGQFQESSHSSKDVRPYYTFNDEENIKEFHSVTTMLNTFTSLESTETLEGTYKAKTYLNKRDLLTGQVLETINEDSKGNRFKTEIIPAYTIPEYNPSTGYGIGSKVENITNKNMLSQEAMSKTYIEVGGQWKETGVGITTWNNDWRYPKFSYDEDIINNVDEKIWRKHKSYIWDGTLNTDGTYQGFNSTTDDNFNWGLGQYVTINGVTSFVVNQTNSKWKNTATTTKYDHYSMPLEAEDINNNFATTKMCDNNTKVSFSTNSKYGESYFSSAEYNAPIGFDNYLDQGVKGTDYRSTDFAHTGKYSLRISSSNQRGFETVLWQGEHRIIDKYRISVWIKRKNPAGQDVYNNARIAISGTTKPFNGEKIFAGDWIQMNHYESLTSANETLFITSVGGTVYMDDFRIHPITSTMTSFVYNEWDELSYILGANNLATHFKYDEAGRLEETYTEVIDDTENNIVGGFKRASKNYYRYKNQ